MIPVAKPYLPIQRSPHPKGPRAMTLAAAFRCPKGGFLLCSDREWNDGVSKRSVDKIYRIGNFAPCDFFIAGAGPEAIIKKTWAAIHEAVASAASNGQDVLHDHRLIIEATLRTIHEQCAKTLQDYPMWLLIVVAPRADGMAPFLYLTNADILIPEPYYAAIGSGKTIADYFSGSWRIIGWSRHGGRYDVHQRGRKGNPLHILGINQRNRIRHSESV